MSENSYGKYLLENDQFFYDESNSKKGSFLKQDLELFNEEEYLIPGRSIQVKRISNKSYDDWQIFINGEKHLLLKGTRFTSKEREFLRKPEGFLFITYGAREGWKSVSEFKRRLKGKI